MKFDVEVHVHVHNALEPIFSFIPSILEKVTHMSVDLSKLTAAVAAQKTVLDSAVAFINGVPALVADAVKKALQDAGIDDSAAQAAADQAEADIEAETTAVQAALTANTPAAPPADTAPPADSAPQSTP